MYNDFRHLLFGGKVYKIYKTLQQIDSKHLNIRRSVPTINLTKRLDSNSTFFFFFFLLLNYFVKRPGSFKKGEDKPEQHDALQGSEQGSSEHPSQRRGGCWGPIPGLVGLAEGPCGAGPDVGHAMQPPNHRGGELPQPLSATAPSPHCLHKRELAADHRQLLVGIIHDHTGKNPRQKHQGPECSLPTHTPKAAGRRWGGLLLSCPCAQKGGLTLPATVSV